MVVRKDDGSLEARHARRIKPLKLRFPKDGLRSEVRGEEREAVRALLGANTGSKPRRAVTNAEGVKMMGLDHKWASMVKRVDGHRRDNEGRLEFRVEWSDQRYKPEWVKAKMDDTMKSEPLSQYLKDTEVDDEWESSEDSEEEGVMQELVEKEL